MTCLVRELLASFYCAGEENEFGTLPNFPIATKVNSRCETILKYFRLLSVRQFPLVQSVFVLRTILRLFWLVTCMRV